ncbi:MAG TPA: SIS domain-containing protein [Bacillota bacterium]|nr:SIS domain-containing protein [Bacillota bacterium]HOK69507.1 SIS domain-containing protein [Bacillota bacterium]HPP85586.1 SIS domain-containing protein [Bacillota bacterium]
MDALKNFLESAKNELTYFIDNISRDEIDRAVQIIEESRRNGGRLHITGIGKPSHVATYAASLISSTGTPAYYLHGTEAVHGSCGQLAEEDVVICISNSGNTAELKATAAAVRNYGCKIIAVTGNKDSWLAKFADCHIFAGVRHEGGPLNRAPRNSYLVETLVLQCISVVLQEHVNLTPAQYVKRHPGGTLGQLRENEK